MWFKLYSTSRRPAPPHPNPSYPSPLHCGDLYCGLTRTCVTSSYYCLIVTTTYYLLPRTTFGWADPDLCNKLSLLFTFAYYLLLTTYSLLLTTYYHVLLLARLTRTCVTSADYLLLLTADCICTT